MWSDLISSRSDCPDWSQPFSSDEMRSDHTSGDEMRNDDAKFVI